MGGKHVCDQRSPGSKVLWDPLSLQALPLHRFVPVVNGIIEGRLATTSVLKEALVLRGAERVFAANSL